MRNTYYVRTNGVGDVTTTVTDALVASIKPQLREIVVEDVMPMLMAGLLAGAIAAAVIGSYFASRPQAVRRNPRRRAA